MRTTQQRAVSVATGATALAASLGGTVIGLAGPAQAAPAQPTLDQATCALPNVTPWNNYVSAYGVPAFKKSAGWVRLHKVTLATLAAWKKAPKAKKPAALRAYRAALAKENAAIAAYVKLNTYAVFTGVANQSALPAVTASGRTGDWKWGTYTTRVLVKGTKVMKACSSVNESAAGPVDPANAGEVRPDDEATSKDLYQGIAKPMTLDIPGTLPLLWYATAAGNPASAAVSAAQVNKCVTDAFTVISTACPKGGLAVSVGGLTGATYTVNGYKASLQSALLSARAARRLA